MKRSVCVAIAAGLLLSGCAGKKRPSPTSAARPGSRETGVASWYGHPYHGRRAANGEVYDMEKMTAAHRTLPFGTWIQVKNLANGKTVDLRVIDRGPFARGRIVDLSHAAAVSIDMIGPGTATVELTVIAPPPQPSAGQFAVQVGSFVDRRNAERVKLSIERRYQSATIVTRDGQPAQWRVLVGREATEENAEALAGRIRRDPDAQSPGAFVVRLDANAAEGVY